MCGKCSIQESVLPLNYVTGRQSYAKFGILSQ